MLPLFCMCRTCYLCEHCVSTLLYVFSVLIRNLVGLLCVHFIAVSRARILMSAFPSDTTATYLTN